MPKPGPKFTLQQVKDILFNAGHSIQETRDIPYGVSLRTDQGAIVNHYTTGKISVQGPGAAAVSGYFGGETAAKAGAQVGEGPVKGLEGDVKATPATKVAKPASEGVRITGAEFDPSAAKVSGDDDSPPW